MVDPAEEAKLVERAKTDPDAFGELYERYVKKIYNYIYYRTGNEHDAEDLTARVFFRALEHLDSYTARGLPFSAWLYRIAHNLVANWHRDRGRQKVVPLDEVIVYGLRGEAPEALAEHREEQERLLKAIRRLPGERQQLLLLKFVERLSNAEIGLVMGRSEGAVKSLYHRTLLTLRDRLEPSSPATPPAGVSDTQGETNT
ncbi:MAG: sigma-70 family RNA polymerase sigma factor [Chloroflexi bacterium]|nr:sigma-70 family RNA polymerase sigma factor [Chloroflexota bacterium]